MKTIGSAKSSHRILKLIAVVGFSIILILLLFTFFPGIQKPSFASECEPNDQDRYVYRPSRLQVLSECIHVTGTVKAVYLPGPDDDGDVGIQLAVDSPFEGLLNEANRKYQNGYLHVESVCYSPPAWWNISTIISCAVDPDPYRGPFPPVGQRVWMEGKWVLDNGHEGWAELHPLYRWGSFP